MSIDDDDDGAERGDDLKAVRVKEIQVKQLDRNITHLRASRQVGKCGCNVV